MIKEESSSSARPKKVYRSHPFSERKEAVLMYHKGMGSKRIALELGIDDSLIRTWLRKYRKYGLESLRPYLRMGSEPQPLLQNVRRAEKEDVFRKAFDAYASSLDSVASIARRYRLEYHSFKYHVERYHPELVARRESLRKCAEKKVSSI